MAVGLSLGWLLGGLVGGYTVKYYARTSVGKLIPTFSIFFPTVCVYFLQKYFKARIPEGPCFGQQLVEQCFFSVGGDRLASV